MAELQHYNPLGAYQTSKSNALKIKAQQQAIDAEASAGPRRNALGNLNLQQQQQQIDAEASAAPRRNALGNLNLQQQQQQAIGLGDQNRRLNDQKLTAGTNAANRAVVTNLREDETYEAEKTMRRMKVMGQVMSALRNTPPEQRRAAWNSLLPELSNFGVDPNMQPPDEFLTDEGLDQGIANYQALQQGLGDFEVHSASQRADGSWNLIDKAGKQRVLSPAGVLQTGEDAAKAIAEGNESELRQTQRKAGAEAAGRAAVEQSQAFFQQIESTRRSLGNIQYALDAIDKGADSGPLMNLTPTWLASTQELVNAQAMMGLDVVGQTTFGALSKGELDLALAVAMPMGLNEKDLEAWLRKRAAAQTKLLAYYQDATMFLAGGRNTIGDWVKQQKQKQLAKAVKLSSGELATPNDDGSFTLVSTGRRVRADAE